MNVSEDYYLSERCHHLVIKISQDFLLRHVYIEKKGDFIKAKDIYWNHSFGLGCWFAHRRL